MLSRKPFLTIILIIVVSFAFVAYSRDTLKWFPFNTNEALKEWEEKIFKDRVLYKVEPKKEGGYLSAISNSANSGLVYKIKFYPKTYPMISWKWKVIKFPKKDTDEKIKGGWLEKDDYAARVYVIFPSWIFTNIKCLEYIWDEKIPENTITRSPYSKNIRLITLESGNKNLGTWVSEERNIYEDYKRAFGKAPGYVGAIALVTDTDNTLSTAEALYTDIKVMYK